MSDNFVFAPTSHYVCFCVGSLFCDVVPSVLSSFDEEERAVCFVSSCSCCRLVVSVPSLFFAVLLVGV